MNSKVINTVIEGRYSYEMLAHFDNRTNPAEASEIVNYKSITHISSSRVTDSLKQSSHELKVALEMGSKATFYEVLDVSRHVSLGWNSSNSRSLEESLTTSTDHTEEMSVQYNCTAGPGAFVKYYLLTFSAAGITMNAPALVELPGDADPESEVNDCQIQMQVTVQDREHEPFKLVHCANGKPPHAVKTAHAGDSYPYSVICHNIGEALPGSEETSIPGKSNGVVAIYALGGKEHRHPDFSFMVPSPGYKLQWVGHQAGGSLPTGVAHFGGRVAAAALTTHGCIPGKATTDSCWYGFKGEEMQTSNFVFVTFV
jgi:hypothetical protein